MRMSVIVYGTLLLLSTFMGAVCLAAPVETSSVLDSSGGVHSNSSFTGVGAVGQGTPLGFAFNSTKHSYSGFLQTYVDQPDSDNDMDGIVDENDIDDDNDGLPDVAEVTGSEFDPVTSTDLFNQDTDGDGAHDGDERVAGTNPLDADSALIIIALEQGGGQEVIEWKSRQGITYDVLRANSISGLNSSPEIADVVTVTGGGIGPFLETTTTSTNLSSGTAVFYGVKVKP